MKHHWKNENQIREAFRRYRDALDFVAMLDPVRSSPQSMAEAWVLKLQAEHELSRAVVGEMDLQQRLPNVGQEGG